MAIRIIKEPDISLTQTEYERLLRKWESEQQYTTAPTSFETWLRSHQQAARPGRAVDALRDAFDALIEPKGGSDA